MLTREMVKRRTNFFGDNYTTEYFYTQNGDVSSIETRVFDRVVSWSRNFDSLNRPIQDSLDNLIFTDYEFDSMSRPTKIKHSKNNTLVSEFNLSYSLNGNITQIVDKGQGYELTKTYSYDSLNRLISATGEEPFNYDLLGNRTDYGASYNLINQRLEDNKYSNTYDLRGNLTQRLNKQNAEKLILTWNNQNQLIRQELFKGAVSQFEVINKYDAQNKRIETSYINKIDSSKNYTRKLIYNDEDVILELDADNKPVVFYIHGAGIDEPLAMVRDLDGDQNFEASEVFYFTKDHLNSVKELLDHNGNIYQRYTYSAYGETKIAKHNPNSKLVDNRYAFTSRELNHHTGLYYYRARWYIPDQGHFLSADTIGFKGQDSNLYRYVKNNPLLFADPEGKSPVLALIGIVGVGGVVGGGVLLCWNTCRGRKSLWRCKLFCWRGNIWCSYCWDIFRSNCIRFTF